MPTAIVAAIAADVAATAIADAVIFDIAFATTLDWVTTYSFIQASTSFALQAGFRSMLSGGGGGDAATPAAPFIAQAQSRTHLIRSAATNRNIVYGEIPVSGPVVFATTSVNDRVLHLVVPLASHECEDITEIWLGDDALGPLDVNGYPTSGKFAATSTTSSITEYLYGTSATLKHVPTAITSINSTASIDADGFGLLTGEVTYDLVDDLLTITDLGTGAFPVAVTYTYTDELTAWHVKVTKHLGTSDQLADADLVAAGIGWTSDHRLRGITYIYLKMLWSAAKFPRGLPNIKAMLKGKKVYDPRTDTTQWSDNWALCVRDYLTLPEGLSCGDDEIDDDYFIAAANISDEDVALDAGGSEKRYTANGNVDLGSTPREVIEQLLTAGMGQLVWQAGVYKLFAGAYIAYDADDDIGEDDILSYALRPKPTTQDVFNAVRGVYVSPDNNWQLSDFPAIKNATYALQDDPDTGQPIWADISLPFTTSSATAQRIAKIKLEKSRQGMTLTLRLKPRCFKRTVGSTVRISISELGFVYKEFQVTSWSLAESGMIELVVQEESSTCYDWSTEETAVDPAPDTQMPALGQVETPTNFRLASGDPQAEVKDDGTYMMNVGASWDQATNNNVLIAGHVELQYKPSAVDDWLPSQVFEGSLTFVTIPNIKSNIAYDFRVRFRDVAWVSGEWSTILGYKGRAKEAVPQDIPWFTALGAKNLVLFKWGLPGDKDYSGAEIRYNAQGNTEWEGANIVTRVTRGTQVTTRAVPPGAWTFLIKTVDRSGLYSTNAVSCDTIIGTAAETVVLRDETEYWETGTFDQVTFHPVTRDLHLLGQNSAQDEGWNTFDEPIVNPFESGTYTMGVDQIDLGREGDVSVYCPLSAYLLPGSAGIVDPSLELYATNNDGLAVIAWQEWDTGNCRVRKLQFRITLDSNDGLYAISNMTPWVEAEYGMDTVTMSVAAGGSSILFPHEFFVAPEVVASLSGSTAGSCSVTSITETGCTLHRFDTAGTDVGGFVTYVARGVRT